ncbi:MAG: hypothetical protein ABJP34_12795 [Erythrobacter sp.]
MKKLIILLLIAGIAVGAWFIYSGGLDRVTEDRVETALLNNGVPPKLAECMAPKLVEDLSIPQLLKLEELAPVDGEGRLPSSPGEAIERLRRVDDTEAVTALASAGTSCAIGSIFG